MNTEGENAEGLNADGLNADGLNSALSCCRSEVGVEGVERLPDVAEEREVVVRREVRQVDVEFSPGVTVNLYQRACPELSSEPVADAVAAPVERDRLRLRPGRVVRAVECHVDRVECDPARARGVRSRRTRARSRARVALPGIGDRLADCQPMLVLEFGVENV